MIELAADLSIIPEEGVTLKMSKSMIVDVVPSAGNLVKLTGNIKALTQSVKTIYEPDGKEKYEVGLIVYVKEYQHALLLFYQLQEIGWVGELTSNAN